jgi:putative multiple sugar transport system substrate-binding protein
MKKKICATVLALSMIFSLVLTGCNGQGESSAMVMVGVSMTNEENSSEAGERLKTELEEAGYTVELAYARSGSQQSEQISAMVDDGAKVLIVDAVDTAAAAETLESITVDVSDVAVISYRDPLDSDASDVYVGRDYYELGKLEAEHIVDRLLLETRNNSITLELVAGKGTSGEQAVAGAMEVLEPYITAGTVEILSGNTTAAQCQTDDAAKWAETMFSTTYAEDELRAILCLGEGQVLSVVDAIQTSYTGTIYPVVAGADCNAEILQYMSRGMLDMVTYSDADELIEQTVETVQKVVSGSSIDKEYLTQNTAVTTETYQELMVESGLYSINESGAFEKN